MIGGIGLVMISLHIRDIGELGRGQQLQIETPKRTGPTAQAPKLFGGGHRGKRWMLADRDVLRVCQVIIQVMH
jgi:hypothetical protein